MAQAKTQKFIPYGKQSISQRDSAAVVDVLHSEWLTTGPKVEEFEGELCKSVGCKEAVVVSSGTAALDIAVGCLGLPKDSEIITTPLTFVASVNAIVYHGHTPVLVDIDPHTLTIDPTKVEAAITKKTRAIIAVDYAGQPAFLIQLRSIAKKHHLVLIEDAAHSIGAREGGKNVGTIADLTIFSFHPVKTVTTGEGGAVVTNNSGYAKILRSLRNHGIDKDTRTRFGASAGYSYDVTMLGRNYRLTDFACALGISQLSRLSEFLEKRKKIAQFYFKEFSGEKLLQIPQVRQDIIHGWHLFPIVLDRSLDRDKVYSILRSRHVGVNVHYIPVYHFTYYQKTFGFRAEDYPICEDVYQRLLSLPIYPDLSVEDQKFVTREVKEVLHSPEVGR